MVNKLILPEHSTFEFSKTVEPAGKYYIRYTETFINHLNEDIAKDTLEYMKTLIQEDDIRTSLKEGVMSIEGTTDRPHTWLFGIAIEYFIQSLAHEKRIRGKIDVDSILQVFSSSLKTFSNIPMVLDSDYDGE